MTHSSHARRWPQLDGLRAFAIGLVLLWHTIALPQAWLLSWWAPGPAGVRLFFVLSGFLITGVLIDAGETARQQGVSRRRVWGAFYARRALRIAPVMYAALAVGVVFWHLSSSVSWEYAVYAGNFRAARLGGVANGDPLGHFWSLAVEEQFYLAWPVVALCAGRRARLSILASLFLIAGAARGWYWAHGQLFAAYALPWTNMDALAAGGLLACLPELRPRRLLVCGACLVGLAAVLPTGGTWAAVGAWGGTAISAALVRAAANGFTGRIGDALVSRPMTYVGTVSYGLYVWHPLLVSPAAAAARWLAGRFDAPELVSATALALFLWLSLACASASWYWLERPINDLKRLVPYVSKWVQKPAHSAASFNAPAPASSPSPA